MSTISFSEI